MFLLYEMVFFCAGHRVTQLLIAIACLHHIYLPFGYILIFLYLIVVCVSILY